MNLQPSFTTPSEAIQFICEALVENDPEKLYTAFTEQPGEFWKEHLFQTLQEIQNTETLERVFLEDGRITSFPANETGLHLGGHSARTKYLHIKLVKTANAWMLGSIHVCR